MQFFSTIFYALVVARRSRSLPDSTFKIATALPTTHYDGFLSAVNRRQPFEGNRIHRKKGNRTGVEWAHSRAETSNDCHNLFATIYLHMCDKNVIKRYIDAKQFTFFCVCVRALAPMSVWVQTMCTGYIVSFTHHRRWKICTTAIIKRRWQFPRNSCIEAEILSRSCHGAMRHIFQMSPLPPHAWLPAALYWNCLLAVKDFGCAMACK